MSQPFTFSFCRQDRSSLRACTQEEAAELANKAADSPTVMPTPAQLPHGMGPQSPLDITSLSLKWSHKGQHREPHVELLL